MDKKDRKDRKDHKYAKRRTFGHLKNKALGMSWPTMSKGDMFKLMLRIVIAVCVLVFVFFHPIYLKSGFPMFKYGATMMLLPPFYFLWAIFKLVSVYLLGMDAGPP